MFANDPMILELIAFLKAHDVRRIVISPGSRHYPIVRSLEADPAFELHSVVDERSAGFFAIGAIRARRRPVGVLTTSGTAAVNLGSAVWDAFYQRLPLVAITADRLPQLLNQMEDQMVDQTQLFAGSLRARALLRPAGNELDRWYNNRVLNEALLASRTNGRGPVHINVPIPNHSGLAYDVAELPDARVIRHHTPTDRAIDWMEVSRRLRGKRVMLLWGQTDPLDSESMSALSGFLSHTDSVVVADHLGNLHHEAVIPLPFSVLGSGYAESGALAPEIVISMGGTMFPVGEIAAILRDRPVEHWRVDPDGLLVDPFRRLTDIFQVSGSDFLRRASGANPPPPVKRYREGVLSVSSAMPSIACTFTEVSIIGHFLDNLPEGSVLHIANSAPMRAAHLFRLHPTIKAYGNRGVNGIDGSMSAAVGHAIASEEQTFLVIGDLSFFYDMNALSIRSLPSSLRILLVNNHVGALMHAAVRHNWQQTARHTSAEHGHSASGWVESLGIQYLEARDMEGVVTGVRTLTDPKSVRPILLEVFTDGVEDVREMKNAYSRNRAAGSSLYRRARLSVGRGLRRWGLHG